MSVASERVQSPIMRTSSTCFLSIHFGRNCLLNKESSAKQPQSDVSSLLTGKGKAWMNEWTGKHARSGLVYFEEMQELEPVPLKSTNNHEPAKCVAFWILNEHLIRLGLESGNNFPQFFSKGKWQLLLSEKLSKANLLFSFPRDLHFHTASPLVLVLLLLFH